MRTRLNKLNDHLIPVITKGYTWTKKHRVIFIGFIIFLLLFWAAYLHLAKGYVWTDWSGFGEYRIIKVNPDNGKPTEIEIQSRTIWDLLGLLLVPVGLLVATWLFNSQEKKREQAIADKRNEEAVLRDYIDKMTDLLLKENLADITTDPKSNGGLLQKEQFNKLQSVRNVAKIRTITALRQLGPSNRNIIFQFLRDANLSSFILEAAPLDNTDLSKSNLYETNLAGANLRDANLSESQLFAINLSCAMLYHANLQNADIRAVQRNGERLLSNFEEANLSFADMRNAKLSYAVFHGANLTNANLTDARLQHADFSCKDREKRTDLNDAILKRADLVMADLRGASMKRVDLQDAKLGSANLAGADLTDAKVSINLLLRAAHSLEGTIMPDGKKYHPEVHGYLPTPK